MERSLTQVQTLSEEQTLCPNDAESISERMFFFHLSGLPPFWEVERISCELMMSLGVDRSHMVVEHSCNDISMFQAW